MADPIVFGLQCVVVTPERALLDEKADFVALPLYDGELGVLPGRAPLVGQLGYGELRIRYGGRTSHYFIDGGFVQIRNDVITVLTGRAIKVEEIDITSAKETLLTAIRTIAITPEKQEALQKTQERARSQIRMVERLRQQG